ncbi:MAG: FliG C-terminal domain-containing protein [Pseudomonadota bacterium]
MSLPAMTSAPISETGLTRSARLMRALGAKAASVWNELSSEEANQLSVEMDRLSDDAEAERGILRSYVDEMHARPTRTPGSNAGIWAHLSMQDGAQIARLLESESPQVIAVILSRLTPDAAAKTVRALPRSLATEALKRVLTLGDIHSGALKALEQALQAQMTDKPASSHASGHAQVAQIFDQLDPQSEQTLLAALDGVQPGAGEKIRALMFTFEDLARLDPASLQTILANIDRAILTLALKGASESVTDVFFQNLTQRAGDLLRDEIAVLGPIRRAEIDQARANVLAVARTLVKRGDILAHEPNDELVE